MLKTTFSGFQSCRWQPRVYLHSFCCCCLPNLWNLWNSPKIWPYSSSRSSKVIGLGVNRKLICKFLLVINRNCLLLLSKTCLLLLSRYWRLKLENGWFSIPPLFDAPARGNPLEFLDETYLAKTRGMGLPYGENFMILTSTVFDWSTRVTDRQTDKRAIACSVLSICAICCRTLTTNKNRNLEIKLPRLLQSQGRHMPDGENTGIMNCSNQFTIWT